MFTFNAAGKPIFIASNIFVRKSRATQSKTSLAGSRPNGKLNLSKVAKETSQPKGVIEEVMRCVIETFTVMVNKGRGKSARLSFNPVGEVTCNNFENRVNVLQRLSSSPRSRKAEPAKFGKTRCATGIEYVCRKGQTRRGGSAKHTHHPFDPQNLELKVVVLANALAAFIAVDKLER